MNETCRRPTLHRAFAAAIALALLASPALAALYKWTDAAGKTVYSDQPPTGNVKYEVVGGAPPPANPNAARELANKEADFKKRQQDKVDAAGKAEKESAEQAKVRSYCAQLRNQLVGLGRADVAMYRLNEKGDRVLMEDAERKAEAAKIERTMRERNCPAG